MRKLLGVFFIVLGLSACTTVPGPQPTAPLSTEIHLQGLFSVVTSREHPSGHFVWEEDAGHQQFYLELSGPLGLGATTLSNQNNGGKVVLTTSSGKSFVADTPEAVLQKALGWSMPISGLRYWILGQAAPDLPFTATYDKAHRLLTLQQSGWSITYTWKDPMPYPSRIVLLRKNIRILLVSA